MILAQLDRKVPMGSKVCKVYQDRRECKGLKEWLVIKVTKADQENQELQDLLGNLDLQDLLDLEERQDHLDQLDKPVHLDQGETPVLLDVQVKLGLLVSVV